MSVLLRWMLAVGLGLIGISAHAQPDTQQRIGTTVADSGAAGYRFERITLSASPGGQRYRLQLVIPVQVPPAQGYPVVWMIDGNAALMTMDAALLESLGQAAAAPLLVFVAHDNDLRIDAEARAFDYTPRRPGDDAAQLDPMGRRGGGADGFLAFLTGMARDHIAQRVRIDPARQTLWGHSYGGVFVLHALFTRPQSFNFYAAVDPSLWWGEGYPLKEAASALPADGRILWLMAGEGAAQADRPAGAPARNASDELRQARQSVPADAGRKLAQAQQARGLDARYIALPGLSHGQTLGASLPQVLRHVSGLPETP